MAKNQYYERLKTQHIEKKLMQQGSQVDRKN